jgi:hypothetical protein
MFRLGMAQSEPLLLDLVVVSLADAVLGARARFPAAAGLE